MIVSKASFNSEGLENEDKLPPSRILEAGHQEEVMLGNT